MNSVEQLASGQKDAVERAIERALHSDIPLARQIAAHSNRGGKRIRPALVLYCHALCGGEHRNIADIAAAVELMHAATLLHDDVLDESTLRRGHATVHKHWGNRAAILGGDFLFSRSVQLIAKYCGMPGVICALDTAIELSEGEFIQIMTRKNASITRKDALRIASAKTASLFSAACFLGACAAKTPQTLREKLTLYGRKLGMAFQIIDDILDYRSDSGKLGKNLGGDMRQGRMTLPVILARRHANKTERDFLTRVFQENEIRASDFECLVELIENRQGFAKARLCAENYALEAQNALCVFDHHHSAYAALLRLSRHAVDRQT